MRDATLSDTPPETESAPIPSSSSHCSSALTAAIPTNSASLNHSIRNDDVLSNAGSENDGAVELSEADLVSMSSSQRGMVWICGASYLPVFSASLSVLNRADTYGVVSDADLVGVC